MSYYEPLEFRGVLYDLAHLEPFVFNVSSKKAQKDLRVHVTFANHCFTKSYDASTSIPGDPILFDGGNRPRSFCPTRYQLSKDMLPGLLHGLAHQKVVVWQTVQRRNWVHITTIPLPAGFYNLFFEIRRAEGTKSRDLNLTVESAYDTTVMPDVVGTTGFVLLCGKVYCREPVATRR